MPNTTSSQRGRRVISCSTSRPPGASRRFRWPSVRADVRRAVHDVRADDDVERRPARGPARAGRGRRRRRVARSRLRRTRLAGQAHEQRRDVREGEAARPFGSRGSTYARRAARARADLEHAQLAAGRERRQRGRHRLGGERVEQPARRRARDRRPPSPAGRRPRRARPAPSRRPARTSAKRRPHRESRSSTLRPAGTLRREALRRARADRRRAARPRSRKASP